jgi:hypothetical protein
MTALQVVAPKAAESTGDRKNRPARRRFLAGVGASGLATAAVMFGRSTPAFAVSAGCCNLCYSPGDFNSCDQGTHYLWACAYGSEFLYCYCCEHGTTGDNCNGVTFSAYTCHYG